MTHAETATRVTLADIEAAARRLSGVTLRTPLLPFREGAFIKAESLQLTGSFKLRGAYNTLSQLSAEERAAGVVAHSSGNHAQAVARAARLLGIRAVVVMPSNAPRIKVEGVQRDGAEIIFVGPHNEERVARAHEIADGEGMHLVSSANDHRVIAGQGTIGLEIAEQLTGFGVTAAPTVVVPVGLGGMAAGISIAVKSLWTEATVYGAEPALAADTQASLAAGRRVAWPAEQTGTTIADGLRAEQPAELAFPMLAANLAGVVAVSENEIIDAMRVAATEARLVLEPSGATALAAHLSHRDALGAAPTVLIASGGNVDPDRYVEWLAAT